MKSKHVSEPFLERDGAGGGGGAGGRQAPAKHGCFIPQQARLSGSAGLRCASHLGNLFSSFTKSQMTAAQRAQAGVLAERKGGGQREQCKTGTRPTLRVRGAERRGTGCSIAPPAAAPAAPSLCRQQPPCHLTVRLGVCCSSPTMIFQAGKTPNRLLRSRSTLSKVLLKRGNEPICLFLLKHGGMFLVTLYCMLRFAPGLLVG